MVLFPNSLPALLDSFAVLLPSSLTLLSALPVWTSFPSPNEYLHVCVNTPGKKYVSVVNYPHHRSYLFPLIIHFSNPSSFCFSISIVGVRVLFNLVWLDNLACLQWPKTWKMYSKCFYQFPINIINNVSMDCRMIVSQINLITMMVNNGHSFT